MFISFCPYKHVNTKLGWIILMYDNSYNSIFFETDTVIFILLCCFLICTFMWAKLVPQCFLYVEDFWMCCFSKWTSMQSKLLTLNHIDCIFGFTGKIIDYSQNLLHGVDVGLCCFSKCTFMCLQLFPLNHIDCILGCRLRCFFQMNFHDVKTLHFKPHRLHF